MKLNVVPPMKIFSHLVLLSAWFCVALASAGVSNAADGNAPPTGEITGYVSHGATRGSLEGVTVEIAAIGRRTLTDAAGRFRISGLAPGNYAVLASYPGLDAATRAITLGAGDRAIISIELTSEIYRLEAFTVTSDREGNAASLIRQRNANNIISVVSLDAFGDVADGNVGNFLQKLPASRPRWQTVTSLASCCEARPE